ncbi:MAG TPA: hypothetical protein VIL46_00955 [Gemmataceae bacterium]
MSIRDRARTGGDLLDGQVPAKAGGVPPDGAAAAEREPAAPGVPEVSGPRDTFPRRTLVFLSQRTALQVLWLGLLLGVWIELITVWMRFGVGLQSTRDTAMIAPFTFGLRIHHGYIGVLLILAAAPAVLRRIPGLPQLLVVAGVGLAVSDLAHHFLVLWPITGSPQFHLVYPQPAVP